MIDAAGNGGTPMNDASGWSRKSGALIARAARNLKLTFDAWREHARLRREFAALQQRGEFDRTLADTGIAPSDVPRLMRTHPGTSWQLGEMMRRLGIDRAKLPRTTPMAESLREMEWRCGECTDWRKCREWLAAGHPPETYRAFCPNAAALDALRCRETAAAALSHGVLAELAETEGECFEG
jgi:uncharacterized protein YjiS (DUF1127 family)